MNPEPFRIEPTFSPRIWGAHSLAPIFPEKTNLPEPIGEAWLTGVNCRIATGPFAGKSLGQTWRQMPAEWRGRGLANVNDFPILVKFLFPTDKLSIQVHPDDAYVPVHEKSAGGRGKTEMWHIVSAEPDSYVLLGLKPGVTREAFVAALENDAVEELLLVRPVQATDTIFVPACTPHAIGPGSILCEVQEYSDLTYRVYDYNRRDALGNPRELHVEKALAVINFADSLAGKTSPLPLPVPSGERRLLAACSYFSAERWDFQAGVDIAASMGEHFELVVVLNGSGTVHWQGSPFAYRRGDCWFVPAATPQMVFQPGQPTSLIRTFVPDISALHTRLLASGISISQLSKTLFL